ncbi:hypothetical protein HK102_012109, partial [Quaeritorhiza haematococci]
MDNCMGAVKPPHPGVPPVQPVAFIQGVVVNFEEVPSADPSQPRAPHKLLVYANPSVSRQFPIPESYWPESITGQPPARTAHPTILYTTRDDYYAIPEGFPFDRYGMEQNHMAKELLTRRPGTCWTPLKNALRHMGYEHVMPTQFVESAASSLPKYMARVKVM